MGKAVGYLRLMRPVNCLMMGFAVIVGAVISKQSFEDILFSNLVYGFITGFALAAASMVINDFCDKDIDAINEPSRPIPSGLIKPEEALVFASVLTAIGFVAAFLTNTANALVTSLCFMTAIISWMVSVAYATVGKRTGLLGNFLVSACVAIPFIYGSLAVTNRIELNVLIFASMAFLSNTGREITKGIVDVRGDRTRSIQTLAVRYGKKTAASAATLFYLLAVLLSPLPSLNRVSIWFLPLVAITDFGLVASSVSLLRNYSRENARKVKRMVLLWFMTGLLAFILGIIQ